MTTKPVVITYIYTEILRGGDCFKLKIEARRSAFIVWCMGIHGLPVKLVRANATTQKAVLNYTE